MGSGSLARADSGLGSLAETVGQKVGTETLAGCLGWSDRLGNLPEGTGEQLAICPSREHGSVPGVVSPENTVS